MSAINRFDQPVAGRWILILLWLAVLGSALGVVRVSQQCRQLYATLNGLQQDANNYQVEWGQYLLEQSSWASFGRIEQQAASELGLVVPQPETIVLVVP